MLKPKRNYIAYLKRLKILVDVFDIDWKNRYITWWDCQFSRSTPPDKLYEAESFDDIILYKRNNINRNIWEKTRFSKNK